MPNTLRAAALFLINTLFDLYLFILIIRIILVYVRSNYFDSLTQFIVKLTDFIIKPLRRVLPNLNGFETASIVLVFALELIKFYLISYLSFGTPNVLGLLILALADILKLTLLTFFYAILLQAIISWIQPYSPMSRVLYQFTAPIMRPFHRLIPPVGGIDISPIPALIILQLLIIVLVNPLTTAGFGVAFG